MCVGAGMCVKKESEGVCVCVQERTRVYSC